MSLNTDLLVEIEVLNMFNMNTTQQGLKIHSDADPEKIAAGKRLFTKGMTTQDDGGYLTPLGLEAAELAQSLLTMLHEA